VKNIFKKLFRATELSDPIFLYYLVSLFEGGLAMGQRVETCAKFTKNTVQQNINYLMMVSLFAPASTYGQANMKNPVYD
jgi:hypothetical protein